MEVLLTIVEFLAVLGVVVVVHEMGHFFTAKAFGIKVNEFGIGLPPRLVKVFHRGETDYTLNLLPIGGFVRLEGENDPSQPRSLASKGVGTRLIVLVAGVFMNLVLAIVLFTGFYMFTKTVNEGPTGITLETDGELEIIDVAAGSPAGLAGVQPGDIILEANGIPLREFDDLVTQIDANRGQNLEWVIGRGGVRHRIQLVPRVSPPQGIQPQWYAMHPWDAVAQSLRVTWSVPGLLRDAVSDWITDDGEIPFASPIGIAQGTGEFARELGPVSLVFLAGILSISLAILNILPIPALDGGRVVFVLLEWVRRGKRIPPEKEGIVHLVGFVVLIGLLVALGYNDIMRIVEGKSLLR